MILHEVLSRVRSTGNDNRKLYAFKQERKVCISKRVTVILSFFVQLLRPILNVHANIFI